MESKKNYQIFSEISNSGVSNINADHLYKPRAGDVIINGPPKTGTTWLQQILHQIRTKGDESFKDIYEVTWMIQFSKLADVFNFNAEQVCNPRIYKCHWQYEEAPKTEGVKYVIIVRNPFDIFYSLQKFLHRHWGGNEDVDEETMVDLLKGDPLQKKMSGQRIMRFFISWWHHRLDANVFWVHYEDLLQNLELVTKQLAAFIEVPLTHLELKKVCSFCTFEYMSANTKKFTDDSMVELMALVIDKPKWQVNSTMVRADGGKSGQGSEKLGPNLKKLIEELWNESIKKELGFTNYDEMYSVGSRLIKNTVLL